MHHESYVLCEQLLRGLPVNRGRTVEMILSPPRVTLDEKYTAQKGSCKTTPRYVDGMSFLVWEIVTITPTVFFWGFFFFLSLPFSCGNIWFRSVTRAPCIFLEYLSMCFHSCAELMNLFIWMYFCLLYLDENGGSCSVTMYLQANLNYDRDQHAFTFKSSLVTLQFWWTGPCFELSLQFSGD